MPRFGAADTRSAATTRTTRYLLWHQPIASFIQRRREREPGSEIDAPRQKTGALGQIVTLHVVIA